MSLFRRLYDPKVMLSSFSAGIDFPYVEGLRLDEALHPLTILATGLYGKELPKQDGAPIRLVVPWKYGFKNIKSIVKITLTDKEPPTTWNLAASNEYGFYSNVNPAVNHPRWSQAKERRIGELRFARHAAVQWLRRSSRVIVRRDGPQEILLMNDVRFYKALIWVNALVPLALLGYDGVRGQLGANPDRVFHSHDRRS